MRMARLLEVMARPEVIVAVTHLSRGEATQQDLRRAIDQAAVGRADQAVLSRNLTRLIDLGVLEKPGKRGAYRLVYPTETLALLTAAVTLSKAATSQELELESEVTAMLRRRGLHAVADESAQDST